ncbi:MAG: hypothetical protein AB8B68_00535 [Rickettsiaceae bacterium]
MVQGKYIIIFLSKLFVFSVVIFPFTILQASSWLPEEGRYKFSSNVLFIDNTTRNAQKTRATILSNAHRDISVLLKKQNLTREEKIDLQELESFTSNYEAFNEEIFIGNDIEYGLSQNQSFGLKANFSLEQNLQHKYTNNSSEESFKKNAVRELGFYYKHSLYKDDKWQISLVPEIIYSKNNIFGHKYSYIVGAYIGYAKISKSGKKYFSELGFSIGNISNNNQKNTILKKISFVEGVELLKSLMLINYFEYSFATNGNLMYREVVYDQIAIAKEFTSNNNRALFMAQIGYYWKRSIRNKMFQLSGPIISLCVNL